MIGDFDPEDVWDDSDPIRERLALLARIYESIESEPSAMRSFSRKGEFVRLLRKLADELSDG